MSTQRLDIIMAASEMSPYAKTGGLGEVMGSLPAAVASFGHRVTVLIPAYQEMKPMLLPEIWEGKVPGMEPCGPFTLHPIADRKSIRVLAIRQDEFFDRPGLYGTSKGDYPDNAKRYLYFSKAVLEVIEKLNYPCHVLHCHDWQTGFIPLLSGYNRSRRGLPHLPTAITIHNLAFQGVFDRSEYAMTGLPWDYYRQDGVEFHGQVNFLKTGILFSDAVTTVSPSYSREILTREFGCGLEGTLNFRKNKLHGFLNGMDRESLDPRTDSYLKDHFDVDHLEGRKKSKSSLLKEYGLPLIERIPLYGVVSRLSEQKGTDLIEQVLPEFLQKDAQVIILGSGSPRFHQAFKKLASKFPKAVGVCHEFDESKARRIFAGSDFFLMPSRFEPCGLGQLYAMRYGAIPIVHATGGLKDTVIPWDDDQPKGTGIVFSPCNPPALREALRQSQDLYRKATAMRQIRIQAMKMDYSWNRSATDYIGLYQSLQQKP